MSDDDNIYSLDTENTLQDFVTIYPLPQRAKITEGYSDERSDIEYSCGDVVEVHRLVCPSVNVSFCDDYGIEQTTCIPVNHPARFHSAPYQGALGELLYPEVRDLVRIWPVQAKATKAYNHPRDRKKSFEANERFTLVRLVSIFGVPFLECLFKKRHRLLQLPMECEGHFKILKDHRIYTIEEIVYKQPPRSRVLKLADDPINAKFPLPDIPAGFTNEVIMDEPALMVEISPCDSPGDVVAVPIQTEIALSPREETYTGAFRMEFPLGSFIEKNEKRLPMHITITNWRETTSVCDRIGLKPGQGAIVHTITDVMKVLVTEAGTGDLYAIPMKYPRNLQIQPVEYECVIEVYDASMKDTTLIVRVTEGASRKLLHPGIHVAKEGEVLRCVSGVKKPYKLEGTMDEISTLTFELLDPTTHQPINTVTVDESMHGKYIEILNDTQKSVTTLSKIQQVDLPVPIQFISGGDARVDSSQDGVPVNKHILITDIIKEPCVLANKDNIRNCKSFNLPLRTDLLLMLERTLDPEAFRGHSPQMAYSDGFGEQISEKTKDILLTFKAECQYEDVIHVGPPRPVRHLSWYVIFSMAPCFRSI